MRCTCAIVAVLPIRKLSGSREDRRGAFISVIHSEQRARLVVPHKIVSNRYLEITSEREFGRVAVERAVNSVRRYLRDLPRTIFDARQTTL